MVLKKKEEIDPSVYDYDAHYDAMEEVRNRKKAEKLANDSDMKPKYMDNIMKSAEIRKRDQLIAKDKALEREREAEGDLYADKDKFVTGAYKKQQEEIRKAEEEERRKEKLEEARRGQGGMANFHRNMLEEGERKHREAMEAAKLADEAAKKGERFSSANNVSREKSDADLARELNAKGRNIILNDDGEVADKRQLLSAGLNIVAKSGGKSSSLSNARPRAYDPKNSAFQQRGDQRASRDRQTKLIEQQLIQAEKRAAEEAAEDRAKLERASKSQKTKEEVSAARARYEQRKKEREQAAAQG
jgi:coiled-coil domain-containing protein 55